MERVFIKGFDKDLKCRDYQFEVGKEYKIDLPEGYKLTEKNLCTNKVFHFCDSLQKVHGYYPCDDIYNNRYCVIEVLGQFIENGDKCGSNHIKIVREITGEELNIAKGLTGGNTGLFNSGNRNSGTCNSRDHNSGNRNSGNFNSGNCNSGDFNSGNCNSGYYNSGTCNSRDHNSGNRNSGNFNSGNCNSGDFNSGNRNSGNYNSGYYNSGYFNSGDYNSRNRNSGNYNSGYYNSGNFNSGYYNSGDYNSGIFNSCNNSNGVFCSAEPKINIFNKPSDMTLTQFRNSKYYRAICSVPLNLTEWVNDKLITRTYEEACQMWWDSMSDENKKIIKSMPNFDIDIFCKITGIDSDKV